MRRRTLGCIATLAAIGLVACAAFSADDPPSPGSDAGYVGDAPGVDGAASSSGGGDASAPRCPLDACPAAGTCTFTSFDGAGTSCVGSEWTVEKTAPDGGPEPQVSCLGSAVSLASATGGRITLLHALSLAGKRALTVGVRATLDVSGTTRVLFVRPNTGPGGVQIRVDAKGVVELCADSGGQCRAAALITLGTPVDFLLRFDASADGNSATLQVNCGSAVSLDLPAPQTSAVTIHLGKYEPGGGATITLHDVVVVVE